MIARCLEEPEAVRAGSGRMEVEMVSGQSALTGARAASPLKILVPRPRGPAVWAFLSSFGGGLVAGDETSLEVEIGAEARCFLGTQASTKIYRNPGGKPCRHHLEARLGARAVLASLPDPVQAFADSSYSQRQRFHLGPGSGLVMADRLSGGRVARGERWAFQRFQSRLEVNDDEGCVLADSLLLDRDSDPLDEPHRTGRFNCLALVLVLGAPFRSASARLLDEFAAAPVSRRAGLIRAASPVRGGALLRFAGVEAEEVEGEIRRHLAFLPDVLHDDPWRRKW